ncbi:MAG: serine/threonine-protein kinase, partial [Minicystis sp.]
MNNSLLSSRPSNASPEASEIEKSSDRRPIRRTPVPERYGPGDIFAGKYRIVGLLGEGGMGAVWRAHSLSLDVDVAIKVLHRETVPSHASARLLREARATASIGHPSIVQVFDFGETDDGEPFLIMELLQGDPLAAWLEERGRISATLAVQMLLPIASALVAAHARGIVHRDIKPENIIAVPSGSGSYMPKIVDFGVAKLLPSHHTGHVLTEAGLILGSLEYMSPEQAEGQQEVGEQTDVWALCIVLYELITGQRPFHGLTSTATIFALYTRDPTPTTELAAGDEELWAIIRRGLEKSPAKRWPTMDALGRALAFWAIERGITVDA